VNAAVGIEPGAPGWPSSGTTGPFTMDPHWLPFHPHPSRPAFRPPAGAVDAHCHVFGPGVRFPYAPERKYTPCDAPKEKLWALRDFLGFERNVLVQATCHGSDNRALVDALYDSAGRARGVATVAALVTDAELSALDAAGVRGIRFNFVRRLVETTPREVFTTLARRVAPLGWHVVVYFEADDLPGLYEFLVTLPTTVVVDHMGRPDVTQPVDGPAFGLFVRLMREHPNVWSKVSCPERLSRLGPPGYDDVVPFARRLVEEFPDRVLWGTDWPHPNLRAQMPDDGQLVDVLPRIAPSPELQRRLLVDNPMRLYWNREERG
jgi:2-pyrone-4,6-dicarboxylate lactonase